MKIYTNKQLLLRFACYKNCCLVRKIFSIMTIFRRIYSNLYITLIQSKIDKEFAYPFSTNKWHFNEKNTLEKKPFNGHLHILLNSSNSSLLDQISQIYSRCHVYILASDNFCERLVQEDTCDRIILCDELDVNNTIYEQVKSLKLCCGTKQRLVYVYEKNIDAIIYDCMLK